VTVCERASEPCAESSAKNAAILRTLEPDPAVGELCRRGSAWLREPPREISERPLVDPCGLLVAARAPAALAELRGWTARDRDACSELGERRARALAPHLAGALAGALWFPGEGRILIAELCAALAAACRAAGVELRLGAAVRALAVREHAGARRAAGVELAAGEFLAADVVVLAAGGWAGRLARAAGSRAIVRPTRRHLVATEADAAVDPRWPVLWVHDEPFYARPEGGGLLLTALDEVEVDPDVAAGDWFDAGAVALAFERARAVLAFGCAPARRAWAALRTFAADERPLVGWDPDVGGLAWAAALGGHGMTCGLELGRLAAGVVLGSSDELAREFDPARAGAVAAR
jgi:D-arginine dehydrogenase